MINLIRCQVAFNLLRFTENWQTSIWISPESNFIFTKFRPFKKIYRYSVNSNQLADRQNHNKKIIYTNRRFKKSNGFCFAPTRVRTHAPRLTAIGLTTYAIYAYCTYLLLFLQPISLQRRL